METVLTGRAYAKINLTLDIHGRRDDGYHLLSSVMQQISLYDDITVALSSAKDCMISVQGDFDCPPEQNLCYRAADAFFREFSISGVRADISVVKRIPAGAGLGGGSSDAATVIRLLAGHYGVSDSCRLSALCLRLGADVPFFLQGGTQLMEGIGEKLSGIDRKYHAFVLLAKPPQSAPTGDIYREFDRLSLPDTNTTNRFLAANRRGRSPFCHVFNALERATEIFCGEVARLKENLCALGAHTSAMSGSGTAVYGLFSGRAGAEKALSALQETGIFCGLYEFM